MSFAHRFNSDGTIDSICDQCFITVSTSTVESSLQHLEAAHTCEPARVAYYHQVDLTAKRAPCHDLDSLDDSQQKTGTTARRH